MHVKFTKSFSAKQDHRTRRAATREDQLLKELGKCLFYVAENHTLPLHKLFRFKRHPAARSPGPRPVHHRRSARTRSAKPLGSVSRSVKTSKSTSGSTRASGSGGSSSASDSDPPGPPLGGQPLAYSHTFTRWGALMSTVAGAGKNPSARPVWLKPSFEAIPKQLRKRKQFVLWRATWNGRKWTKPPSQTNGYPASHSNPAHWDTFERACFIFKRGGWDGIGYVLSPDDHLVGIDLDHCRNPKTGRIAKWALELIDQIKSYTEVSPSATGIRIFMIGKLPDTGHKRTLPPDFGDGAAIEIYDKSRFLTLTGHRLKQSPVCIMRRQRVINKILVEYFPIKPAVPAPVNPQALAITDRAVIDIAGAARTGREFAELYFKGRSLNPRDSSDSGADYALIKQLLFFSQGNREQAERIFSASALGHREKWNKREDYRRRTIDAALSRMTGGFYTPDHVFSDLARLKARWS